MITIKQEPASICVGTLCELFYLDGREVFGKDFNLNLITFAEAVSQGLMRFFVARKDGEPIGYCCFSIFCDAMHAHIVAAQCNALYVKPEYRGKTSIRLLKYAEAELKANENIQRFYISAPDSKTRELFEKLGYNFFEYHLKKDV